MEFCIVFMPSTNKSNQIDAIDNNVLMVFTCSWPNQSELNENLPAEHSGIWR